MAEGDELLGELEGDDASEGMPAKAVRALGLDLADLREEPGREILDPRGVGPFRGLVRIADPEEGLLRVTALGQLEERQGMSIPFPESRRRGSLNRWL